MLTQTELHPPDDDLWSASYMERFLFLCSDFGWSVYLDSVGDKDPANIRPEVVHVQRGTPTNLQTGERKFKMLKREYGGATSLL